MVPVRPIPAEQCTRIGFWLPRVADSKFCKKAIRCLSSWQWTYDGGEVGAGDSAIRPVLPLVVEHGAGSAFPFEKQSGDIDALLFRRHLLRSHVGHVDLIGSLSESELLVLDLGPVLMAFELALLDAVAQHDDAFNLLLNGHGPVSVLRVLQRSLGTDEATWVVGGAEVVGVDVVARDPGELDDDAALVLARNVLITG